MEGACNQIVTMDKLTSNSQCWLRHWAVCNGSDS